MGNFYYRFTVFLHFRLMAITLKMLGYNMRLSDIDCINEPKCSQYENRISKIAPGIIPLIVACYTKAFESLDKQKTLK
jgi:hypothetical protein